MPQLEQRVKTPILEGNARALTQGELMLNYCFEYRESVFVLNNLTNIQFRKRHCILFAKLFYCAVKGISVKLVLVYSF